MSDSLATYLHDHKAGSNFAIELLESLQSKHSQDAVGDFAATLLVEIREDGAVLQRIITRVGGHGSGLKEATAWVAEKVARLKLTLASSGELGTFEALEALSLGIMGKLSLWRALATLAPLDARLAGEDYDALAARAQDQFTRVDRRRLQFAIPALHPASA